MKKLFLIFCLVFISLLKAQDFSIKLDEDIISASTGTISSSMRITAGFVPGGKDITATGTLRIPVVFVRFADDISAGTYWPDADVLPDWASTFIDSEIPSSYVYPNVELS